MTQDIQFSIWSPPTASPAAFQRLIPVCGMRIRSMQWRISMQWWMLVCWLLLPMASGCHDSKRETSLPGSSTASAIGQDTAASRSGTSVSPNASPKEVAMAALQAIEANDKQALQDLVAINKVQQDVEAITRGRPAFQSMVKNAIPTAVSAIMLEIGGLDSIGREIDQETITGGSAVVTVKGKRAGQEQTRRFFLVQEDNQWRLVPSHRS
jgi:hypothetical protein